MNGVGSRIRTGRPARLVVAAILMMLAVSLGVGPTQASDPARRVTPVVEAYRKASPAVVNISAERVVRRGSQMFGPDEEDPFQEFMPDLFGRPQSAVSLGSGFIIHPDGYIVTNAHVVGRGEKITVSLADKSTYAASVVAANTDHDLAVLHLENVKGRKFEAVAIGRSDDVMIGETVLAIGNPLGYQNTCTTGVVSAIDRKLVAGGTEYKGVIQVDAPINPGNSGGPLLNILGEVIGINTAIRSDAQGIGFAMPIDALMADFPRLLDYERLNRVVVGLSVQQQHNGEREELIILAVTVESPAAAAGLQKDDRILAVDETPLRQISDFQIAMLGIKPGKVVHVKVKRGKDEIVASVTIRERPKADGPALALKLLGLELEPLTPDLSKRLGLPIAEGMVVTGLAKGGLGERVGLHRGDILFQLGKWYMKNWDGIISVLEDAQPGEILRIGVLRGNVRAWATIQLPAVQSPASNSKGSI